MVLSLRLSTVWLSSLPALSLQCLRHLTVAISPGWEPKLHVAWLPHPALVTFGVERHSVPVACLSHP